jgi:predicted DNA-binding ribbon-helix-helix protein
MVALRKGVPAMGISRLVNRNVIAGTGRTSIRLEPELWDALAEICRREDISAGEFIRRVERAAGPGCRTSAVRVQILQYFRSAATEDGHDTAGHGPSHLAKPRSSLSAIL